MGVTCGMGNDSLLSITLMSYCPLANWYPIQTPQEAASSCMLWVPMTSVISSPTTLPVCPLATLACHFPASGPLHLLFPQPGTPNPQTFMWLVLHLSRSPLKRHLLREAFPDQFIYHYTHLTLCPLNLHLFIYIFIVS